MVILIKSVSSNQSDAGRGGVKSSIDRQKYIANKYYKSALWQ